MKRPTRLRMAVDAVTALLTHLLTPTARQQADRRRDVDRHADLRIHEAEGTTK